MTSRNCLEGSFKWILECAWRSTGRILIENALMASFSERYLVISTRTSGHNPVDWPISNGRRNCRERLHLSLKVINASRTSAREDLWPVCDNRSQRCRTWHWCPNGEKSPWSPTACSMTPINMGQSSTGRSGNCEAGKTSNHHFFSLTSTENRWKYLADIADLPGFVCLGSDIPRPDDVVL